MINPQDIPSIGERITWWQHDIFGELYFRQGTVMSDPMVHGFQLAGGRGWVWSSSDDTDMQSYRCAVRLRQTRKLRWLIIDHIKSLQLGWRGEYPS